MRQYNELKIAFTSLFLICLIGRISALCNCRGGLFYSSAGEVSCPENTNRCSSYANDESVLWAIHGGGVTEIKFTNFSTDRLDTVSIIDNKINEVFQLSGSDKEILQSEFLLEGKPTSAIYVYFRSDKTIGQSGFRFTYKLSDYYRSLPAPTEIIRSVAGLRASHAKFGAEHYPSNFTVAWSIHVPQNRSLRILFMEFDTEQDNDELSIFPGLLPNLIGTERLHSFSGNKRIPLLRFSHSVTLIFMTNENSERRGFKFQFALF